MSKAKLQINNSELNGNNIELTDILDTLTNSLVDLSNDTVTADVLLKGMTAHDANGRPITGTMPSNSVITEIGIMVNGEPVTVRDDGSRLTTVFNGDSIVETRTFLDGTTETKTTVFNDDETVTETTVANGKTTTKVTTFTPAGMVVMCTDNGNKIRKGASSPAPSVGIDGDVFVLNETNLYMKINGAWTLLAGEVSE